MVKPLRSNLLVPPDVRFKHFGVLNAGAQSKGSVYTSLAINLALAFVGTILGLAAKETITETHRVVTLVEPLPEPVRPAVKPPSVTVAPPRLQARPPDLPKLKVTERPPAPQPAPPKLVAPPPAPRVNLARAVPASVPNRLPRPMPVALGLPDNPIAPSSRPATSKIDLGERGVPGMAASNTGQGARATAVNLGSGSPQGQNMNGRSNAATPVRGVRLGVPGGTGPLNSTGREAGQVNLGRYAPPAAPASMYRSAVQSFRSVPKVLYKPRPEYTAEAIRLHIEGTVTVRVRVMASGAVRVLGVTSDLGHGLGESATRAVAATRFQPATDDDGNPVDWEGIVNVAFQLAE
ncbi:MAG: TonB family protein [Acidobacteriaceae bacterium]|nr:TonB family protein [Acidobacteriaceae bacterium]